MGSGEDIGQVGVGMNMIRPELWGGMTYPDGVEGQDAAVLKFLRHDLCTVGVSALTFFFRTDGSGNTSPMEHKGPPCCQQIAPGHEFSGRTFPCRKSSLQKELSSLFKQDDISAISWSG